MIATCQVPAIMPSIMGTVQDQQLQFFLAKVAVVVVVVVLVGGGKKSRFGL